MQTVTSVQCKGSPEKKNYSILRGLLLIALVLVPSVFLLTCDATPMWDYLNKDLILSRIVTSTSSVTIEESDMSSGGFQVNMLEQPTALVVIALSVTDTSEASILTNSYVKGSNENYDGPHLEFTPTDYMETRSVFIAGAIDTDKDGPVTSSCVFKAISEDRRYDGITWEPVTIISLDDEVGGCYTWSRDVITNAYIPISDGQELLTSGLMDDYNPKIVFADYPMGTGFKFNFAGDDHLEVNVSINGLLVFDTGNISDPLQDNTTLFTAKTTDPKDPEYVLAPWWDDLQGGDVMAVPPSQIYFKFIGTAPDRVLIIEWSGIRLVGYPDVWFNFEVKLHETSNRIEFVYGGTSANPVPTITPTFSISPTPTITPTFTLSPTPTGTTTPKPTTTVTPTPTPTPTPTFLPVNASLGIKGAQAEGPNYIDGSSGDSVLGRADLKMEQFPDYDTVITFTPVTTP